MTPRPLLTIAELHTHAQSGLSYRADETRAYIAQGIAWFYSALDTHAPLLDCGHRNTHELRERCKRTTNGYCGGTGYGVDSRTGAKSCYACCAEHERAAMIRDGRGVLYYVEETGPTAKPRTLTDWAGHLAFRPYNVHRSHGYGFGRRYPLITGRFVGPDGFVWSFRNAGDQQLARCKRTKERTTCKQ